MNLPVGEPHSRPRESGKRVIKANKSCVPCRKRKVKCDAAVIGLPCSSCTCRQCTADCVLPTRKSRSRKLVHVSPNPSKARTATSPATTSGGRSDYLIRSRSIGSSTHSAHNPSSNAPVGQSPCQTEPDLLYLNILNDAVTETKESGPYRSNPSSTFHRPSPESRLTLQNRLWRQLPHLDDVSNECLVKKGVFDLPPPRQLDALVKTYFDYVYPFAPVIDRAGFIRSYQSGDCSLFLLRVILAPASVHASTDVLSACGFASRTAAQESLFSKAKLLYDFAAENDPLLMLQGSIILCSVILDHPSDRDFGYWFHNAVGLATKLDLRSTCVREDKPPKVLKLCRRIWWSLYSLDVFHVFLSPGRSRLLEDTPKMKPRAEDDGDDDHVSGSSSDMLPLIRPQQRALPVVLCELAQKFGQYLFDVTRKPCHDPRQMMDSIDAWRRSLSVKMHVTESTGTDVYYQHVQALSYRYECILSRLIRRGTHLSQHEGLSEWTKLRLRSAILELDTIAMRVLANGTLQDFPVPFVSTMTALLALHIESALDPAETRLVHSMARASISQIMLVLDQGKEIPLLKRAVPIFEEILIKKNLYSVPLDVPVQENAQSQSQRSDFADAHASSQTQGSLNPPQSEQHQSDLPLYGDFLGLDFLDSGHWSSMFDIDMASHEPAA